MLNFGVMKKLGIFILFLALSLQMAGQNAKYVFVLIGDGMGLSTVELTQYYKASMAGKHGTEPLTFCNFPVCNYMTTWSVDSQITDSAAAATSLASGVKTNNKFIGLDANENKVELITEQLAAKGKKIALVTTDAVNYATPAGFSAHRNYRKDYDNIFLDMLDNGFCFYAGGEIRKSSIDPFKEAEKAGYTIVGNMEECGKCSKKADKILFIPDSEHHIGRAIEREGSKKTELTVADFTKAAVDFMMKGDCKDGFFIMAEVGVIDHDCHGNDAAAAVLDVLELEKVADVALDFYNKHPKETAIIVLSDHDTGGLGMISKEMNPALLQYQMGSISKISRSLEKILKANSCPSWEEIQKFLSEKFGLWTKIKLKNEDEMRLKELYDKTIAKLLFGEVVDEYGYNHIHVLVNEAAKISNKRCGIVWSCNGHTAAYVPFYYLGPQPELFMGRLDNTDLHKKLLQITGE